MAMITSLVDWAGQTEEPYLLNAYQLEGSYDYPLHTHRNQMELVYCAEGSFEHVINDQNFQQVTGDLLLIREQDRHRLKGRSFRYYNLALPADWTLRLFTAAGNPRTEDMLTGSEPPKAHLSADDRLPFEGRLRELFAPSPEKSLLKLSRFLLFALDLFFLRSNLDPENSRPPWLEELLQWIGSLSDHVPAVSDLAWHACKCPEHLSRSFRKHLGISPGRYLSLIKLKRAADLLACTNYPAGEIGRLCSYENANYFHKQFRSQYGLTPLEYRRRNSRFIHQ